MKENIVRFSWLKDSLKGRHLTNSVWFICNIQSNHSILQHIGKLMDFFYETFTVLVLSTNTQIHRVLTSRYVILYGKQYCVLWFLIMYSVCISVFATITPKPCKNTQHFRKLKESFLTNERQYGAWSIYEEDYSTCEDGEPEARRCLQVRFCGIPSKNSIIRWKCLKIDEIIRKAQNSGDWRRRLQII